MLSFALIAGRLRASDEYLPWLSGLRIVCEIHSPFDAVAVDVDVFVVVAAHVVAASAVAAADVVAVVST